MSSNDSIKLKKLGQYVLKEKLGHGAVGAVWLSHHPGLNIPVAVKILDKELAEEDEEYVERFILEGQLTSKISQRNLVRIYDAGKTAQGEYFIVMEYIEGKDALGLMKEKGKLPVDTVINIAFSVCNALIEAHDHDIIHRDIKPDNIMITNEGKVKLADLGLAKKLNDDIERTVPNSSIGTPNYMAPEQAVNTKDADERSDIYSLGATLYALLTGTPPFIGDTCMSVMLQHVNDPLEPPQKRNPDLPDDICDMICKMMAKSKDDRYRDCHELMEEIYPLHMKYSANAGQTGKLRRIDFDKPNTQIELPERSKINNKKRSAKSSNTPIKVVLVLIFFSVCGLAALIMNKQKSNEIEKSSNTKVKDNTEDQNADNKAPAKNKNEQSTASKANAAADENKTQETGIEAKEQLKPLEKLQAETFKFDKSPRISVENGSFKIKPGSDYVKLRYDQHLSKFRLLIRYRFISKASHFALAALRQPKQKENINFFIVPEGKQRNTGSIGISSFEKKVNGEIIPPESFFEAKHNYQKPVGEENNLFLRKVESGLRFALNGNFVCEVRSHLNTGSFLISFHPKAEVEIISIHLAEDE